MIQFNKPAGQRFIELGCGNNRHPQMDVAVDCRPGEGVDFACDLEAPLPIADEDFHGAYSAYAVEHLSWRKTRGFLKECLRILKPTGKLCLLLPNTRAQIAWLSTHPEGWDDKGFFDSASCVLFGDQDYSDNTHKAYLDPDVITALLSEAGFENVTVRPWGERQTDMLVTCAKPKTTKTLSWVDDPTGAVTPAPPDPTKENAIEKKDNGEYKINVLGSHVAPKAEPAKPELPDDPAVLYAKDYFNGGKKYGGYAREGYWDFPVHEITARKVLERKPESVLELGCARGYVLKRVQDAGVHGVGIEVSRHCLLTRACDGIRQGDVCDGRLWPSPGYDLCYSVATLEHVPEDKLPRLIALMKEHTKRGLHGVDFGDKDDGFDKTHCCLRSKIWWEEKFATYAPGWPVEVVDKEELEAGPLPERYLKGDGKVKLNLGSYTCMFHNGWVNIDSADPQGLTNFAAHYGYNFLHHDLRNGLPYDTGSVDMIYHSHVLEHFSYAEGLRLLKECRRVLKPDTGIMRLAVPDARFLMERYAAPGGLDEFDEINDGAAACPTAAGKLWALLHEGHAACYDEDTAADILRRAGFEPLISRFRQDYQQEPFRKLQRETVDSFPTLSLFCDSTCR
jgi:predicted SAM-dependent methyltransferase